MSDLDDIKKRFIVDDDAIQEKQFVGMIVRANRFIKVSKSGQIHFELTNLTNKDRVALVFIGRFLGNRLEPEIRKEVLNEELSTITGLKPKIVSARISELKKEPLIERIDKGVHRAISLFIIDRFLKKLEQRLATNEI
ncbi:MAG: hypothetical protein ACFFCH_10870 [Promethearchaeota archaeon]